MMVSRIAAVILALHLAGGFSCAEPPQPISRNELDVLLHAHEDRPLLLVYWASWCVPCRNYRKKLEAVRAEYPETRLRMLAVAVDTPERVEAYLAQAPLPYPVRITDAELLRERTGRPVPTTLLIRRDGTVERELVGDTSEKRLHHYVERILMP